MTDYLSANNGDPVNGQPNPGGHSYGEQGEGGMHQHQEVQHGMMSGTHEEPDDTMDTQGPSEGDGSGAKLDKHKLFIGGLHPATVEQTLTDYFGRFGTIKESTLKVDPETSKARFAFIIFDEDNAVDDIVKAGPHEIDGKIVDAKMAVPHNLHQQLKFKTKKVFVGGVPTDMPESEIRCYFEQFGAVDDVALVTQKGESVRRGFCFVTFVHEDSADKVCNKQYHKLDKNEVEVKRATPREPEKRMGSYHGGPPHFMGRGRGHLVQPQPGRGQFAPYGGHAGYYQFYGPPPPPPPGYGGGYMGGGGYSGPYGGYGGYGGYDQYGGGRRDDAYNSRYGPMRSNYGHGHSHSHVHSHHPYSR